MKSTTDPTGQILQARDGTGLFVLIDEPMGPRRGMVVLTHGMGEHSGRYGHVASRLTAMGLRVVRWDLRGHGRSEGGRGDMPGYESLVEDLSVVWEMACAEAKAGPRVLYGHSLGGQITINFAAERWPDAVAMVITSPWLRLEYVPPAWKVVLARSMVKLWPSLTQDTGMRPERLSRDIAFLQSMPDPGLVHQRMSARMYMGLMEGADRAYGAAEKLEYPMLLVHGERDPITSVAATEDFYGRLGSSDKTLVIVPEAVHETHNDLCREDVLRQIIEWLKGRLPAL